MARVLIVDDNKEFRQTLADKLKESGYEVAEAENGVQALDAVAKQEIDLILLDILMPEMSGTHFAYELKNKLNKDIPIIVLTNVEEGAYQEYIKEYLVKANTSLDKIVETIKKYV